MNFMLLKYCLGIFLTVINSTNLGAHAYLRDGNDSCIIQHWSGKNNSVKFMFT
jgi:hypothetical protein